MGKTDATAKHTHVLSQCEDPGVGSEILKILGAGKSGVEIIHKAEAFLGSTKRLHSFLVSALASPCIALSWSQRLHPCALLVCVSHLSLRTLESKNYCGENKCQQPGSQSQPPASHALSPLQESGYGILPLMSPPMNSSQVASSLSWVSLPPRSSVQPSVPPSSQRDRP